MQSLQLNDDASAVVEASPQVSQVAIQQAKLFSAAFLQFTVPPSQTGAAAADGGRKPVSDDENDDQSTAVQPFGFELNKRKLMTDPRQRPSNGSPVKDKYQPIVTRHSLQSTALHSPAKQSARNAANDSHKSPFKSPSIMPKIRAVSRHQNPLLGAIRQHNMLRGGSLLFSPKTRPGQALSRIRQSTLLESARKQRALLLFSPVKREAGDAPTRITDGDLFSNGLDSINPENNVMESPPKQSVESGEDGNEQQLSPSALIPPKHSDDESFHDEQDGAEKKAERTTKKRPLLGKRQTSKKKCKFKTLFPMTIIYLGMRCAVQPVTGEDAGKPRAVKRRKTTTMNTTKSTSHGKCHLNFLNP
jgi:hypothetical protein